MAQLADMGVAIPQEYRADMALAGEWQTLSETKVETPDLEGAAKSIGVRKRKHEGNEDEDDEGHAPEYYVSKGWGSRMRVYPGAQDDEEDLDALLASTKDLKKIKAEPVAGGDEELQSGPAPQKREDAGSATASAPKGEESPQIKTENSEATPTALAEGELKEEQTPGVVFKKRKPKAMRK